MLVEELAAALAFGRFFAGRPRGLPVGVYEDLRGTELLEPGFLLVPTTSGVGVDLRGTTAFLPRVRPWVTSGFGPVFCGHGLGFSCKFHYLDRCMPHTDAKPVREASRRRPAFEDLGHRRVLPEGGGDAVALVRARLDKLQQFVLLFLRPASVCSCVGGQREGCTHWARAYRWRRSAARSRRGLTRPPQCPTRGSWREREQGFGWLCTRILLGKTFCVAGKVHRPVLIARRAILWILLVSSCAK